MIINSNITAMNTHRRLGINQNAMMKAMVQLSSGMRINRAGDDPAGLAISEKMRAQIRGLNQASRNAQDGISMIQTAEGALNETHAILQRMRELSVQAANDTNTEADRNVIQNEINQLTAEINRIGNTTEFNTKKLLNGGSLAGEGGGATGVFTAKLQIGANQGQSMTIQISDMRAEALGLEGVAGGISVLTQGDASAAIDAIDAAIEKVSGQRSSLGAYHNRLEHTISNLNNSSENLSAAESRIRDVDMAAMIMEMTRANLLSQVSLAMLAQSMQHSQGILRLLS